MNLYAKPGFVIMPFAQDVNMAPNSATNVLIVAQNQTTVNQTVTNIVPNIPSNSEIRGTVTSTDCGFLSPDASCEAVIRLQSGNQPRVGNLNVSVCSFNGAFCSRIVNPLTITNSRPVGLFIFPTNPSIANHTTQQFFAISLFSNATIQNVTDSVTWRSSNTSRATISDVSGSKGLATGVAPGISTISAILGNLSDSTTLTITPATLTSISVTPVNSSIAKGTTQAFVATGIFSDNSNQDLTSLVTWSSSNTNVATISNTISQKGMAFGNNVGTTTITATLSGVSGTTNLNVTPATLRSISVTPTNPNASVQSFLQFTATGIYSDNSIQNLTESVTWHSQFAQVAIISNQTDTKGLAFALGPRVTRITATLGNISGSTVLSVTPAKLVEIDIEPIIANTPAGTQRSYVALGIYDNHIQQDITKQVTWLSSNTHIATISNAPGSEGSANGIQVGNVIISATSRGIVGRARLTVDNPILVSIAVTPTSPTIPNGTKQQFTATGTYSDTSTQILTTQATWFSSLSSVAAISNASGSKGLAQAVGVGATNISAIFNGISGSTPLTVSPATLVSIDVTPANSSMPVSTNQQFTATGTYSDASSKNITSEVTWSSSNTAIATISNASSSIGVATSVSAGATTIRAIKNSITGSTTLNVNSANNCFVQRRADSNSYWLGYDIFTNSAPMILNFSATGINLTQIIVNNGVFSNVQVLDQNQLLIGAKPPWVSMTTPGFIDFHGPNYGPYEPFNSPIPATCQTSIALKFKLTKMR